MTNTEEKAMEKLKEEYWSIFVEPLDFDGRISNLNNESYIVNKTADQVWSWISTNFVPKEEVEIAKLEGQERERNKTRRAFCEVCKVFIDVYTGKRSKPI